LTLVDVDTPSVTKFSQQTLPGVLRFLRSTEVDEQLLTQHHTQPAVSTVVILQHQWNDVFLQLKRILSLCQRTTNVTLRVLVDYGLITRLVRNYMMCELTDLLDSCYSPCISDRQMAQLLQRFQ
jgi:hypothetical protein